MESIFGKTLKDITDKIEALVPMDAGAVDADTGEFFGMEELEALEAARTDKINGVIITIKNLRANAAMHKAEADAQKAMADESTRRAEWLEGYLRNIMNGEKFESQFGKVSYTTSYQTRIACGLEEIPSEYLRIKAEADKTKLKKAIQGGAEIAGVTVEKVVNMKVK